MQAILSLTEDELFVSGSSMGKIIDPGQSKAGSHRLSDAARCTRKHFLKREATRDRAAYYFTEIPPFVKGSLVHLGLAQMYMRMACEQHGRNPAEYEDPISAMREKANDKRAPKIWLDVLELCEDTYNSYYARYYRYDIERYQVIAVEKQYEITVQDPDRDAEYCYTQRLDLGVRDNRTGRVHFWDHKTTEKYENWLKYRYEMALQFMGYRALGNVYFGSDFGGVSINYIQLAGIQTTKSGARKRIPAEFHRPTTSIAPMATPQDLRFKIIQVERQLADWDPDTNEHVETAVDVPGAYDPSICRPTKLRACEYYDLCHSGQRHTT